MLIKAHNLINKRQRDTSFSRSYLINRKQYLEEIKGWMSGERKFLVTKMLL